MKNNQAERTSPLTQTISVASKPRNDLARDNVTDLMEVKATLKAAVDPEVRVVHLDTQAVAQMAQIRAVFLRIAALTSYQRLRLMNRSNRRAPSRRPVAGNR